jgi:phosphoserine phosphatase
MNAGFARHAAARAAIFCLDVDSTLIATEAIDELAAFAGKKEAVAALTAYAMGGSLSFRASLAASLDIVRPSVQLLRDFMAAHPPAFTPGVEVLIAAMHRRGSHVYLVSGGFTQFIFPLADKLGIPRARVFANTILFDRCRIVLVGAGVQHLTSADSRRSAIVRDIETPPFRSRGRSGAYAGFDPAALTSEDGGKGRVVALLRATHPRLSPIVVIGDGVTDMQARPPADAFIGYGGVVVRAAVEQGADWFVRDWAEVLAIVESVACIEECGGAEEACSVGTATSLAPVDGES